MSDKKKTGELANPNLITTADGRQVEWRPLTPEDEMSLSKDPKMVKAGEPIRQRLADLIYPENTVMNTLAQNPEVHSNISIQPLMINGLDVDRWFPVEENPIQGGRTILTCGECKAQFVPAQTFEQDIAMEACELVALQEWMATFHNPDQLSVTTRPVRVISRGSDGEEEIYNVVGIRPGEEGPVLECVRARASDYVSPSPGLEVGSVDGLEEEVAVVVWKCYGCGASGWAPYSSQDSALQLGLSEMRRHNEGCEHQAILLDGFDNGDELDEMGNVARWKYLNMVSDE